MRIRSSEITSKALYLRRREFLALGAAGAGALLLPRHARAAETPHGRKLDGVKPGQPSTEEKKNSFEEITHYNNFYEFGTDKDDPARHAAKLQTRPWTVKVEGECAKPAAFDIDELLKLPLEERVYRLRCVEAWSMVIPWDGFPLATLLEKVQPTSRAKYVAFETAVQPKNMPGVGAFGAIPFPYLEGLRIDEAMHPLTLLAVGMYGEELPKQDGAPIRLVVPWKYGFKSAKSLVRIRLQETQPPTTWSQYGGGTEYGFYANVNPEVDHPRWSQAKERRIGELFRKPTQKFNGYADQVGKLYAGMDLRKFF
ncbi:MAG: protein-methionine-sulfoxide reductase catalytic subunit MsrP [Deltaproteobacteria bacterium]|nr:MAG: protein-methionine-sulfoxide reductase catalytic subunit MsrP [Deltaproteobacteria bacterium]